MKRLVTMLVAAMATIATSVANAGEAEIVEATAKVNAAGAYTFSVTLNHDDEGWKHYANAWDVVAPDGTVLGKRKLHHPHVDEQPFTRSLSGVKVPAGITSVKIRAYDSVHGLSKATFELALPGRKTEAAPEAPVKSRAVKKRKAVTKNRIVRKRKVIKERKAATKSKIVKRRTLSKRKVVRKRNIKKSATVRRTVRKSRRGSF